jgi:hypothetical protein
MSERTRFVGLDVHKATIAVGVAEAFGDPEEHGSQSCRHRPRSEAEAGRASPPAASSCGPFNARTPLAPTIARQSQFATSAAEQRGRRVSTTRRDPHEAIWVFYRDPDRARADREALRFAADRNRRRRQK